MLPNGRFAYLCVSIPTTSISLGNASHLFFSPSSYDKFNKHISTSVRHPSGLCNQVPGLRKFARVMSRYTTSISPGNVSHFIYFFPSSFNFLIILCFSVRNPPGICYKVPGLGKFARVCAEIYDVNFARRSFCIRVAGVIDLKVSFHYMPRHYTVIISVAKMTNLDTFLVFCPKHRLW